jgi:hypothetical protein
MDTGLAASATPPYKSRPAGSQKSGAKEVLNY